MTNQKFPARTRCDCGVSFVAYNHNDYLKGCETCRRLGEESKILSGPQHFPPTPEPVHKDWRNDE